MFESAKESVRQKASSSEIYGKMEEVFVEMDSSPDVSQYIHENWRPKLLHKEQSFLVHHQSDSIADFFSVK